MKKIKHVKFICVVHDVDSLRKLNGYEAHEEDFCFIQQISDFFIVHNKVMFQYFENLGIDKYKLISLQIFDYLYTGMRSNKIFEKSITIAGNLSMEKSTFLGELGKLAPLKVHLYGPNLSENILKETDNIAYGGSISAELLPQKLDKGFGLVWDGKSIDTCSGAIGEYLRYNNPHKMSLYLAVGLPVIIWSGAAQADFVKTNHVGIVVDSLYEIFVILQRLSEDEYFRLVENTEKLSRSLMCGEYTRLAIQKAEERIGIM